MRLLYRGILTTLFAVITMGGVLAEPVKCSGGNCGFPIDSYSYGSNDPANNDGPCITSIAGQECITLIENQAKSYAQDACSNSKCNENCGGGDSSRSDWAQGTSNGGEYASWGTVTPPIQQYNWIRVNVSAMCTCHDIDNLPAAKDVRVQLTASQKILKFFGFFRSPSQKRSGS